MTAELAIPSYDELGKRLVALSSLQPGWDGESAPAPSVAALLAATRLLLAFQSASIQIRSASPDVEGGIILQMVSQAPEISISFECSNDGTIWIALMDYRECKFTFNRV